MRCLPILLLSATAAFSQDPAVAPEKPPAEVEQALRARIEEFYTLMLKGEYRKLEALVAENTKDAYYLMAKPRIAKFEIVKIEWSDQFTRARATTMVDQYMDDPQIPVTTMRLPIPSVWKIEDGKWCWFLERREGRWVTPFFTQKPGEQPTGLAAGQMPKIDMQVAFAKVTPDKPSVTVKPGGTGQITFTNNAMGPMKLSQGNTIPGIAVKFDPPEMNAQEKAVMTLTADKNAKSGSLTILIAPTGEMMSIEVLVQ